MAGDLKKERWRKIAQKMVNRGTAVQSTSQVNQIVREKEIIMQKEVIVKIRCPYCKTPFNETLDKCPNCGARA